MIDILKNNYNINIDKLYEIQDGYYFYYSNTKYYILSYIEEINSLNYLIKITNDLYNKNYMINTFIVDNKGKYYFTYNEVNYVLTKVNDVENYECTIKDIIYFNNLLILDNTNQIDYSTLWSKKIDDLEEEIDKYYLDYPLIEESIDYYIGLSENAISYYKDSYMEEEVRSIKINLNHKRMPSKVLNEYLNNPLNITFDYEIRDIAEYLKAKAVNKEDYIDDIYYIRNIGLSSFKLRILFSRLLYPTYYIDAVEKVIIENYDETTIKEYIDMIDDYEYFLRTFLDIMNEKYSIPKIDWLYK